MSVTEPHIRDVQRSASGLSLRFSVPTGLLYLEGHFPGFAILPGIVQIDWAIRYARRYLLLGPAPAASLQVKFRKPIRPERPLELRLAYATDRRRLSFECRDETDLCSSGQVVFAEP
jgi:3-hydroxymyristoyl/3-hydroxydecanoyl-(acyl carrier protein) dehydratase